MRLPSRAAVDSTAHLGYVRPNWLHEPGYRRLAGLNGFPVQEAIIRQLWIVDDLGLNSHWVNRYQELRARVRS